MNFLKIWRSHLILQRDVMALWLSFESALLYAERQRGAYYTWQETVRGLGARDRSLFSNMGLKTTCAKSKLVQIAEMDDK